MSFFKRKKKKENKSEEKLEIEKKPSEDAIVSETISLEQKKKKRELVFKIISSSLVFVSLGLFIYSVFLLISDSTTSSSSPDSYITLMGSNITKSKEIYSQFGNKKKKKAADFALIGTKFFLSETKITPSLYDGKHNSSILGEGNTNFYLYNVTSNPSKFSLGQSYFENNTYYVDLNNIEEGDYLIYSDYTNSLNKNDLNPYSLSTDESVYYSSYSLPDENGMRKRITIRNNSSSPFLLINITNCGTTLPTKYYDAVIFFTQYERGEEADDFTLLEKKSDEQLKELNDLAEKKFSKSQYKVKVATSLQDAYNTNAILSFSLSSNDEKITSLYTIGKNEKNFTTEILSDTSALRSYDANPEIREMIGYLGRAGENNIGVVGNDVHTTNSYHMGKESYILSYSDDVMSEIEEIL